jgi:hypothetical protein
MSRWLAVSLVLFACGGSQREVSKVKYTHGADEGGVPLAESQQFKLPDEERPMIPHEPPTTTMQTVEPTCKLVAETLVSLELGNYAEPEERAPKVAAEEKRCAAAKLPADDRQCVIDSPDRQSVAYCAPVLFPNEPQNEALTAEQCKSISATMKTRTEQVIKSDPNNKAIYERQLAAVMEACRADRWNAQMAQCAANYVPMYWQNCMYIQPYGMWKRNSSAGSSAQKGRKLDATDAMSKRQDHHARHTVRFTRVGDR